jgi:hypothetical protein
MATVAAYFDDSGTHDDATNVVCGGVAGDSEQLRCFENDWNAVLRMQQYDLDYLHMKEMKSGKGKFAKFQHDLQLQRSLYERLHALTKIRTKTFGCVVLRSAFDRIDAEFQLHERSGSPFVLAASISVYWLRKWMERYHCSDDLTIVFDKIHFGASCARSWTNSTDRRPVRALSKPCRRCRRPTISPGRCIARTTRWFRRTSHPGAAGSEEHSIR